MKKTLSLLLVFTLLLLTACQPASDTPSDTSSKEESTLPPTPWEQLQTLSDELSAAYESVAPTLFLNSVSMDMKEGTGTLSYSMSGGSEDPSLGESMSFEGTVTIDENTTKTEVDYSMGGVIIPIVAWNHEGKEYTQYPEMYPDGVFRTEDLGDAAILPSIDFFSGNDGGSSDESFTDLILEHADPNKNMTVTEKDGNKIFSLTLEGKQAAKLWTEVDMSLNEMFGALNGEDSIMGELSTASEGERKYTKAVLTVTTDGKTFQKCLLEGFDGETLVDCLTIDSSAGKDAVNYSVSRKEEGVTTLELTITATDASTTMKGELPGEETSVKMELTFTPQENGVTAAGSITMTQDMGGFSFSIPMELELTVSEENGTTDVSLSLEMNVMEMSMVLEMAMSVTPSDVTLDFPYENAVLTYDEEEFYTKMMETYPDLFYTSQSSYYYSEDEKLYMSVDEDGYVDIYVDTVYTKDGNVYTIENFGSYTIEEADGSYTINGTPCDGTDFEGSLSLFLEGDTGVSLGFYEDGTCSVNLWGYGESDSLRAVFEVGDSLALSWQFSEDYTTVTVLGQTLYLDLSGSTEL